MLVLRDRLEFSVFSTQSLPGSCQVRTDCVFNVPVSYNQFMLA